MTTNDDKSPPAGMGPTLRDMVEGLAAEWKALLTEVDTPRGGMRVPFHSPWASAPQLLSVMSAIRRWTRDLSAALAAPPAQPVTEPPPPKEPPKRTCNRHDDCDAADAKAKAAGQSFVDHCHDDCCEDCFGS
jgi:hypothetical protein